MVGFDLSKSEFFHLGPELDVLRRHSKLGQPHGWQLEGCTDLAIRIDRAILSRREQGLPAALDLYRLRKQADDLVLEIMDGLEKAGKLRPEGDGQ
jgi:hypothetical protein